MINSKSAVDKFYQFRKQQTTEASDSSTDLYSEFKTQESALKAVLSASHKFPLVLSRHISLTTPKTQLQSALSSILSSKQMVPVVVSKQLLERFWSILKLELKLAESELSRNKHRLEEFIKVVDENREVLAKVVKQAWECLTPLEEPHLPDSDSRKLCARLLVCVAETVKLKMRKDKGILKEVKDMLGRAQRLYSFDGRTMELFGQCHVQIGDFFGGIYWLSRSLCLVEGGRDLISCHDKLREKWNSHMALSKVSSQPSWYISFCLSFLRLHGLYFTKISTENTHFLMRTCMESLSVFLDQKANTEQNSNLLVSMVHIWIFSVHSLHTSVSALPDLINHNSGLFDSSLNALTEECLGFFFEFLAEVTRKVSSATSAWVSSILVFLYWVDSYPGLLKLIPDFLKQELVGLSLTLHTYDQVPRNTHLVLPEDFRSIGFLPLHYYYLAHKDFMNEAAKGQEIESIRIVTCRDLLEQVLENTNQEAPESFDTPGLFFEEAKKVVVIDGRNVAVRHGNGEFSSKGLNIAVEYFACRGFEVKVVVPEQYLQKSRKEQLKFHGAEAKRIPKGIDILEQLDSQGVLIKTPPWDYDDAYCIQFAKQKEGIIVSNDRFWDLIDKDPSLKDWLRSHVCSYTFAGQDFLPNPDFNLLT